jgi:hypothetical protein
MERIKFTLDQKLLKMVDGSSALLFMAMVSMLEKENFAGFLPRNQVTEVIGMTESTQRTSEKRLEKARLIDVTVKGKPPTNYVILNMVLYNSIVEA